MLTAKTAEPLASSLLSLEATFKDYYSILNLLIFLYRLLIRFERLFYRLMGLIVIFFDENNSGEYEVEAIQDSVIYAKKSESGHHLLGLYYLASWKRYLEEKKT